MHTRKPDAGKNIPTETRIQNLPASSKSTASAAKSLTGAMALLQSVPKPNQKQKTAPSRPPPTRHFASTLHGSSLFTQMPTNQAQAQISTKTDRNGLATISGGRKKGLTLDDFPPDLDLRSALDSAAAVTAGVFGGGTRCAAEESRESASDARRSLAPSSRSPATAGRCRHRPAPSAFLAFLNAPSIPAHPIRSGTQIRPESFRLGLWQD
jgi:hypothetical protein